MDFVADKFSFSSTYVACPALLSISGTFPLSFSNGASISFSGMVASLTDHQFLSAFSWISSG